MTTYYPVPSGNYKKIQAGSIQLVPTTLSAVQDEYNCSYDPSAGKQPCPPGIMYFDKDAQVIYFSTSNHWAYVNATCVPITPCSATINCGNDSCGNICGSCQEGHGCSSTTSGIPGTCN